MTIKKKQSIISKVKRFFGDRLMQWLIKANYYLPNYSERARNVIWLVGDGRSGTTWVSNLINYHNQYRYLFEPFHPKYDPLLNQFQMFHYLPPHLQNTFMMELAQTIFTGRYLYPRVDRFNRSFHFKGLLVKDIFGHLFLKWADVQFPHVKKILLLRHPCPVALSKEKFGHWMSDPKEFLSRPYIYEDFLEPFEAVIKKAESHFERQMVMWSIVHYIPLKQLNRENIHLVFYEELCINPEDELQRMFAYLGDRNNEPELDPRVIQQLRTPSRMSRDFSAINTDQNLINRWQKEVTEPQIEQANRILEAFGLDKIYNAHTLMPNRQAAEALLDSSG